MEQPDLNERVVQTLESLADLADKTGMQAIRREIRDERLPAIREGRLSMVVLGEFNHGKSTAINALLGQPLLPTGITPTTAVITHVRYGQGLPRVVRESGSEEVTWDQLRQLVTQDAAPDLRYIEISTPSPLLASGLTIVDTPGVNDISRQKVEITYGYVPRADLVLYVLDATQALKKSEVTFIQDRLLRQSQRRLFFLLGKVDALTTEELDEVTRHVEGRIHELVGPAPIYPVSARRATTGSDPGFDTFRTELDRYLSRARTDIIVEGAVRTGVRLASIMDQSMAIELSALRLGSDELDRRIRNVRARLEGSRVMVGQNLELIDQRANELKASTSDTVARFAREFAAALPREIQKATPDDIKKYLPSFVQDTFKEWLEEEGALVAARLEQLAEEIIEITNRNMRDVLNEVQSELGVESRSINLEVDTFGYDVGVFALGALGVGFLAFSNILVGGLLTLAAPVLAFVLKDRVDDAIRTRATEQGVDAISRASQKIDTELARNIDEFANRLKQFVEDTGDRMYRQIVESLDRVQFERRAHADNTEPVAAELDTRRKDLGLLIERLGQLRDEHAAAQVAGADMLA
jgi:ribosome biogenesis GTPase A